MSVTILSEGYHASLVVEEYDKLICIYSLKKPSDVESVSGDSHDSHLTLFTGPKGGQLLGRFHTKGVAPSGCTRRALSRLVIISQVISGLLNI